MARLNVKEHYPVKKTAEGAIARNINAEAQLRRSVMSCMLWEDIFYEEGQSVADRIAEFVPQVDPVKVSVMAVEARSAMHLRHVPLLLAVEMAKHKSHRSLVASTLYQVIQRADELTEALAIYSRDRTGSKKLNKLSKQFQRGIAMAFQKFNGYQLAKYNRPEGIKLRDALFLSHAAPKDEKQAETWKKLIAGELPAPDTWEVALSAGKDKKETWERLMREGNLGGLALLRNLRNMTEAGVEKKLIIEALESTSMYRVLPFRYIAAAIHAPQFEEQLDALLVKSVEGNKLPGKSVIIEDVSGSMYSHGNISKRSDMSRVQAAAALAVIARDMCEEVSIYATAGNDSTRKHATALVPNRRGMALADCFQRDAMGLGGGGIFLTQCLDYVGKIEKRTADRIIVFTDEQDCDLTQKPEDADAFGKHNYLLNISVEKNGIGYKPNWIHIDGFSEAVFNYIKESECVQQ